MHGLKDWLEYKCYKKENKSIETPTKLKELLQQYGIRFDRPGVYEFASISLPWFSSECKTNIEIEIKKKEGKFYEFHVLFVPDLEGIVERNLVLTASIGAKFNPNRMLVDRAVRGNMIPEFDMIEFFERQNAYSISNPHDFLIVLERILAQLSTKKPCSFESAQEID